MRLGETLPELGLYRAQNVICPVAFHRFIKPLLRPPGLTRTGKHHRLIVRADGLPP